LFTNQQKEQETSLEESLIGMGVTIVVLTFWLALVAVYLAPSLIVWRKQLPATPWFVAVNVLAGRLLCGAYCSQKQCALAHRKPV